MADTRWGEVRLRLLSAAVLIPLVLAAAYLGGAVFGALVLVFAVVMGWEWNRLCGGRGWDMGGAALMVTVAAAAALATVGRPDVALAIVAGGGVLVYAAARVADGAAAATVSAGNTPAGGIKAGWLALGAVYIGVPVLALVWLRDGGDVGRFLIFWLFGVVWAGDAGAYAVGRLVGGPRLAPTISPGKTWAGFGGGLAAAAAVGWAVTVYAGYEHTGTAVVLAVVLSTVAQAGDLFESAVKRRFGVKDTGRIIPGHGGVFDRVDGLLAAAPVAAALVWIGRGGVASWP